MLIQFGSFAIDAGTHQGHFCQCITSKMHCEHISATKEQTLSRNPFAGALLFCYEQQCSMQKLTVLILSSTSRALLVARQLSVGTPMLALKICRMLTTSLSFDLSRFKVAVIRETGVPGLLAYVTPSDRKPCLCRRVSKSPWSNCNTKRMLCKLNCGSYPAPKHDTRRRHSRVSSQQYSMTRPVCSIRSHHCIV